MPFALVIIGLVMIVTGAKDTYKEFGGEVVADFTGPGNFTWWLASVGAIGALGYIDPLKTFSRAFMALVLIAMLISNRGFFAQLNSALSNGPVSPETGEKETANDNGLPALGAESDIAKKIVGDFDINNFRADPGDARANFDKAANIAKMFIF